MKLPALNLWNWPRQPGLEKQYEEASRSIHVAKMSNQAIYKAIAGAHDVMMRNVEDIEKLEKKMERIAFIIYTRSGRFPE